MRFTDSFSLVLHKTEPPREEANFYTLQQIGNLRDWNLYSNCSLTSGMALDPRARGPSLVI